MGPAISHQGHDFTQSIEELDSPSVSHAVPSPLGPRSSLLRSRPHQESGGKVRDGGEYMPRCTHRLFNEVEILQNSGHRPALPLVAGNAEGLGATVTFSKAAPSLPGPSSVTWFHVTTPLSMPRPQSCLPPQNQ